MSDALGRAERDELRGMLARKRKALHMSLEEFEPFAAKVFRDTLGPPPEGWTYWCVSAVPDTESLQKLRTAWERL